MTSPLPLFLLLDGNALLHRAWHAIPPLTTKDGRVVNAVYGFAMVIEKMREQYHPQFMAVAWDLPGATFRHELFPEYKAQRVKKEQELYDQIPIIQDLLFRFSIPSVSAVGFEADDVIGTLSQSASQKNLHTLIVTGDLDALQLVNEHTHVLFFQKGISETKLYDEETVKNRYGLAPSQLIDYKALRGDPSDNIPGIAGIGEKTATDLLKRFQNIEGMFANLEIIEEKVAKKLRNKEALVEQSKQLVKIVTNIPLEFSFSQAKVQEPDETRLLQLYRDLEFRTLIKKHSENQTQETPHMQGVHKKTDATHFIKQADDLQKFTFDPTIGFLIASQSPDLFGSRIAAITLSDGSTCVVAPNPSPAVLDAFQKQIARSQVVVTHDVKRMFHVLGESVRGSFFDTMIASYLLNSGSRSHDLSALASHMLGISCPEIPANFSREKEYELFGSIAALLPKLQIKLQKALEDTGVWKIFSDMEMPLVRVLYHMEKRGIQLDSASMAEFSRILHERIELLTKKIFECAGVSFNINSPSQLADVLFTTLALPTKGIKKTKSGFSTAAPELEKLWDTHEIIPLLSDYRELTKLQSTYVEAIPKLIQLDGRIHTTFNQTVAATGRLSSSDPNLQNIPIKTELGREIRKAFVAPAGRVLLAADYSQIELRLMAIISGDKPFLQAFQENADVHTRTACEIWSIEESAVSPEQRRAAKAINFGILYGMGARSLARSTGFSLTQAKEFIDRYFEIHFAVREYMDATIAHARENGYVETLFGRRRYLPEIKSTVPMLVAAAQRMAINMPIQGTQADIIKMAMLRVHGWLETSKWPAALLLQVHDELVLEVDEAALEPVARGVKEMMESVGTFSVPLIADLKAGKNWGEMEKIG